MWRMEGALEVARQRKVSPSQRLTWAWEPHHVALGIVEALVLWSTPQYRKFLAAEKPPEIEKAWFETFIAEWRVARTLKKELTDDVRAYFDRKLRAALASNSDGAAIDKAARHLQSKRWGSGTRKDGNGSLPLSVVAKVGFFLAPAKITPFDSLALKGLNKIRGTSKTGGMGHLKDANYSNYLEGFNSALLVSRSAIEASVQANWAQELGKEFGVTKSQLRSVAFQRKVFDNMLMSLAGRFD